MLLVQASEHSSGDETGEGTRHHVTSVKDRHTDSHLLAGIEHGDHVQSARVEGSLGDTKQEATDEHGGIACSLEGHERDDGPSHAKSGHVIGRPDAVQDHVGGDLATKVSDEENRHAGVVLHAHEAKILFKGVQNTVDHGVSVEEVEEVHGPKDGLSQKRAVSMLVPPDNHGTLKAALTIM